MNDDFRHRAACKDTDPELFFPVGDPASGPYQAQARRAKSICARCPVRAECLALALDQGLDHGIFGGATEDERRKHNERRSVPVRTA